MVNKLRELTGEYLQRTDKGHKNVRYAFKNEKAIEKAKLIVHTSAVEWEKTLSAVLQWNIARESLHETIEPVVMFLPGAMLVGYFSIESSTQLFRMTLITWLSIRSKRWSLLDCTGSRW